MRIIIGTGLWIIAALFVITFLLLLSMDTLIGPFPPDDPDGYSAAVVPQIAMVLYVVAFMSSILSRKAIVLPAYHKAAMVLLVAAVAVDMVFLSVAEIGTSMKFAGVVVWVVAVSPLVALMFFRGAI